MNNTNYTLNILNFQDKNIILNNVEFKNNIYFIHIEQIKRTKIKNTEEKFYK